MTKRERKAAMVLKGVTQAEIARLTGFSDGYVHDIVSGNRRKREIEDAIAEATGLTWEEMFGSPVAL